ncbi:hypothetical protein DPT48_22665 [Salmonella enterica subsp. enterica serovar Enteritidis]|nr:hypothetical protein [Salmonella enterica subsp. enterica serovar Enteritidis]
MNSGLMKCVDCGKELSVTARTCSHCCSTDPFGLARKKEKREMAIVLTMCLLMLLFFVLWYFSILDPFSLLDRVFD